LKECNLGLRQVQLLFEALQDHENLRHLYLSNNPEIDYEGLVAIGQQLPTQLLFTLDLSHTALWIDYDDSECDDAKIQMTQREQASQALLEGIKGSPILGKLVLNGVNLVPHIQAEIDLYVKANRRGRWIILQQDKVPSALFPLVLSKQSDNSSILFLFLLELPCAFVGRGSNIKR
jgi:hypothetical protein